MTVSHLHQKPIACLPTIQRLNEIASQTLDTIPDTIKGYAVDVKIIIENYADKETLHSLRIDDKYELLGLYRGTPIPIKTIFANSSLPDSIYLYRCPLIRYSIENQESIEKLVQHVMIHELGHHFGYSLKDGKA
ncbi:MAG: metallopeptidase family protein [Candidatus Paracaedibacteraceae bacterium]|nr:metallopeptidase family protein [Candidatus Paracaedibacteraceae bacterium]